MSRTNFSGGFPGGVSLYGRDITLGDGSGSTYFVDDNSGHDGNNGTSWEDAFKTLAVAFAASHADIARGSDRWNRRNTIFVAGGWFVEDLDAFPQKTDVIGVGSADGRKGGGITGNHAPTNAAHGTRFINVNFQPTAGTDIMILTSSTGGVEFIGCVFDASSGATRAPSAIQSTASSWLKIEGCDFMGKYSGDVIDIKAGSADGTRIVGNTIVGSSNDGIVFTGTPTITGSRYMLIANNIISVVGKTIDDGGDDVCFVSGNRCRSDAVAGASAYIINDDWAVDNIICCSDEVIMIPVLTNVTT